MLKFKVNWQEVREAARKTGKEVGGSNMQEVRGIRGMQGNWVRLTPLDILLNKQAPPKNKRINILKRPFLPCASCSRLFVLCVVSPSSTGGSAATGSLVKDCHAVRKDPNTLFFKSILIRVKLSFNSTRKKLMVNIKWNILQSYSWTKSNKEKQSNPDASSFGLCGAVLALALHPLLKQSLVLSDKQQDHTKQRWKQ